MKWVGGEGKVKQVKHSHNLITELEPELGPELESESGLLDGGGPYTAWIRKPTAQRKVFSRFDIAARRATSPKTNRIFQASVRAFSHSLAVVRPIN